MHGIIYLHLIGVLLIFPSLFRDARRKKERGLSPPLSSHFKTGERRLRAGERRVVTEHILTFSNAHKLVAVVLRRGRNKKGEERRRKTSHCSDLLTSFLHNLTRAAIIMKYCIFTVKNRCWSERNLSKVYFFRTILHQRGNWTPFLPFNACA